MKKAASSKVTPVKVTEKVKVVGKPKAKKAQSVLSKSPYFQTLLAPWKVTGVKIPDMITTPSFPVNCEQRDVLPGIVDAAASPLTYVGYAITVGGIGAAEVGKVSGVSGGTFTWTRSSLTSAPDLTGVAASARPVSCGLTLTSTTNDANDQGRFIIGFIPGPNASMTGSSVNLPGDVNAALAAPYVTTLPVARRFCENRYIPSDPLSLMYTATASQPSRPPAPGGVVFAAHGVLFIIADGIAQGSTFEGAIYENFECLPKASRSSLANPEVSQSDPIELAMTSNIVGSIPEFPILQSTNDTLAGTSENWVPAGLRSPGAMGRPYAAMKSNNNSSLAALPLIMAGSAGYGIAKSGLADKVPILGGILKAFGGL